MMRQIEAGESKNDELDDLVEDDATDGSRGRVRGGGGGGGGVAAVCRHSE